MSVRSLAPLLALVTAAACARAPERSTSTSTTTPPTTTATTTTTVTPTATTTATTTVTPSAPPPPPHPELTGYPLARLRNAANPPAPLAFALPEQRLRAHGVKSARAFATEAPRLWLVVLELASHGDATKLERSLDELFDRTGAPYHKRSTATGPWLLVAGFPSDKPASPEMERAQTEFLSRWAGEE